MVGHHKRTSLGFELPISSQKSIYCGLIRYGNEIYEGRHEPIISKKLFDDVQQVMSRKSKPSKKVPKYFVFRGLIHCAECGCLITAELQKGHTYYRCTKRKTACSQKYVREESLRDLFKQEIRKVSLPSDWAARMIAELENERATNAQSSATYAQKLHEKVDVLDTKLSRLMDGYLAGAIALQEYQASKSEMVSAKQLLKDKISAFEHKGDSWFEPAIQFIQQAESATSLAKSDDNKAIREFAEKIGSNFRLGEGKLDFVPREAWPIPVKNKNQFNWRRAMDYFRTSLEEC